MGRTDEVAAFPGRSTGGTTAWSGSTDEYSPLVVVIGSPNKSRTEENPPTATEREAALRGCFPDVPVVWLEDADREAVERFARMVEETRHKREPPKCPGRGDSPTISGQAFKAQTPSAAG